jgi:hypothetical protein
LISFTKNSVFFLERVRSLIFRCTDLGRVRDRAGMSVSLDLAAILAYLRRIWKVAESAPDF